MQVNSGKLFRKLAIIWMGNVYSPDHQKAIDLYDILGEGLTFH